ncbi:MAG: phage tail protein [Bacteroidia bacterium]|nr:phage tail protein [Bacteroidia bacterium]
MAQDTGIDYFPPAGFYFSVEIEGLSAELDTMFQEVSGLDITLETEQIVEGGLNDHVHVVPKRTAFQKLQLKRGLVVADSGVAAWCQETLQSNLETPITPKNVTVNLNDVTGSTLMSWSIVRAYPTKWQVSGFNAQQNAIVTETLELTFSFINLGSGGSSPTPPPPTRRD